MREVKYYCDICKKEINTIDVYYTAGLSCDTGLITRPVPNNVQACSVECAIEWLTKLLVK